MKKIKLKKIKEELINFKDRYPMLLFFICANFINSIIVRIFSIGTFSIRPLFFDLAFVMLVGLISLFIGKKGKNVYYIIMSIILVAICVINSIYYNYYSSYVSISLLPTSVFIKDVSDAVFDFAIRWFDWVYLLELFGIIYMIRKNKKEEIKDKKMSKKLSVIIVSLVAIGCAFPPYNCWVRLVSLWNRVAVVDTFGVYIYQIDDIIQSLTPTFNNMFGYDNALKKTNDYYDSLKKEQSANEYTGIFEGKNVIAIHAESFQNFNIGLSFNGDEVTPNINKLVKEGIYFNNFYAQEGVGTSSDTEFTYSTSLLPANSGTVFVNYFNNKFVTIQNLLKDKGYYVFSMHGNVGSFWNREAMHERMGYDKFYSKSSFVIDEEYGLGLSDESFFRQVVPMISDIQESIGKPFYGTLITLTNHTPWREANLYSDLNLTKTVNINGVSVTRDYLEDRPMGNYIKSVNYMDKAIGQFIENMDKAGLLDNTVIVIYGDHDAKIAKVQYDYMYNYDPYTDKVLTEGEEGYIEFNDYDYELNRKVPFIIWTKDMEKNKVVSTPTGMVDVLPTLGNMLGIYNKYALGKDIMGIKNGQNTVVFKDASYVTDKIYYNAKNNEVYTLTNGIISEKYISDNVKYADKLIDLSDDIIKYDLIKDLK